MLLSLLLSCARTEDRRPDVIIVSVDTLRADHLGFMGYAGARTPHMDAIASAGRVFSRATTPFPRTTPALASLLTGLRPEHHGSHEVSQPMTAELTLAGTLAAEGYTTAAVSAIGVASPEQHLDRGFSSFEVLHDVRAAEITRAALAALSDKSKGPAMLWVHYADPHFPYLPDPAAQGSPAAPRCRALGERAAKKQIERALLFTDRDGVSSSALDECIALYDAEIAAVDAAVGDLIDGIAGLRGDRPRIVVLTADHGEHLGEDGLFFEHGPSLHDAVLRIPLVISGPGVAAGSDPGVARLEDVAPTVLELLALPPLPETDGRPIAKGASDGAIALIESGSALHVPLFRYLVSGRGERWCLNEGRWSLCRLGPKRPQALYDHEADPKLESPRTDEPQTLARFAEAAERWRPEQARRYAARTGSHTLLAHPKLDGGYDLRLIPFGSEAPAEDPAAAEALAKALRGMQVDLPLDARSPGDESLLRDLGYVD